MAEFPVPFNDRVISYSTAGGETTFDFDFPVFINTDIKVYRTVAGTTTLQTITTNYTVSINTDQEADPGGTITLVSITVAASETWTIAGGVTVERTTDFAQRGPWGAAEINEEFDKIYMILQEMKRVMLAFEPAMSATIGEIDKDGVTTGYFLRRTASGYDHAQVVSAGSISTPVAIGEGGTGQITAALAFAALKQAATDAVTGVIEIASDAEAIAKTATDKALVPSNLAARPTFSAHKNGTNQTGITSATNIKLTFGTEAWDTGSYFDAAQSRWTPPAGKVALTSGVTFTSANAVDNEDLYLILFKNGSLSEVMHFKRAGTSETSIHADFLVDANGTDFYEIYVHKGGAGDGTVDGLASKTWFKGWAL